MENQYLHDVLPFLKTVERSRQKQFEHYFRSAPLWLMNLLQSEELPPGTTFIRENEPADTIFFIGKGRAKATDYRISGIAYDFLKSRNLNALGGMEVIMELDCYQTTWQTETNCTVVKLPRAQYEKWLYSDMRIFRLEAKLTCESLLEEERRNRLYLFLQGSERLELLLIDCFEKFSKNGQLCIAQSRQSLADETGLCLKSMSRAVKKLADEELLTKKGNQILVSQQQYERLKMLSIQRLAEFRER